MFDTDELTAITEIKPVIQVRKNYTYEDLVHINRTFPLEYERFSDFTEEKYPHGILFYDFEVFMYDWLVVIIDPVHKEKTIIVNDRHALHSFYLSHQGCVWTGYNNKFYDVPILKGILLGHNPKEISDKLIIERKRAFDIYR